jgi:hypothetical protein
MAPLLEELIPKVTVHPVVKELTKINQGPNNSTEECDWRKEKALLLKLKSKASKYRGAWERLRMVSDNVHEKFLPTFRMVRKERDVAGVFRLAEELQRSDSPIPLWVHAELKAICKLLGASRKLKFLVRRWKAFPSTINARVNQDSHPDTIHSAVCDRLEVLEERRQALLIERAADNTLENATETAITGLDSKAQKKGGAAVLKSLRKRVGAIRSVIVGDSESFEPQAVLQAVQAKLECILYQR